MEKTELKGIGYEYVMALLVGRGMYIDTVSEQPSNTVRTVWYDPAFGRILMIVEVHLMSITCKCLNHLELFPCIYFTDVFYATCRYVGTIKPIGERPNAKTSTTEGANKR